MAMLYVLDFQFPKGAVHLPDITGARVTLPISLFKDLNVEDGSLSKVIMEEPAGMVKTFFEELQTALGPSSPGREWSASSSISESRGLVNLARRQTRMLTYMYPSTLSRLGAC
ncbi:hypothetical protein F5144DRAFT_596393 [Chaetomium tenue]|uniref:Uncharacterized protein n=1 Tax=Chaetomium tenue TaxID=1854479 RepID=A0ACB7NZJ7_9PEZI|nr:hypothetical protein F5144DRAFT_596393 [Chaetomium globosum]